MLLSSLLFPYVDESHANTYYGYCNFRLLDESDEASMSNVSLGSVKDRIAIFESLKDESQPPSKKEEKHVAPTGTAIGAGIVGATVAAFDQLSTSSKAESQGEPRFDEPEQIHERYEREIYQPEVTESEDIKREQPDSFDQVPKRTLESTSVAVEEPLESDYIQRQHYEEQTIGALPESQITTASDITPTISQETFPEDPHSHSIAEKKDEYYIEALEPEQSEKEEHIKQSFEESPSESLEEQSISTGQEEIEIIPHLPRSQEMRFDEKPPESVEFRTDDRHSYDDSIVEAPAEHPQTKTEGKYYNF